MFCWYFINSINYIEYYIIVYIWIGFYFLIKWSNFRWILIIGVPELILAQTNDKTLMTSYKNDAKTIVCSMFWGGSPTQYTYWHLMWGRKHNGQTKIIIHENENKSCRFEANFYFKFCNVPLCAQSCTTQVPVLGRQSGSG